MASDEGFSVAVSIGYFNLVYISAGAALGYFIDYRIFVVMTSWVHYCKYIHQYYYRGAKGNMKLYKAWQRDVLLFKSIALSNLAYIYLKPYYDAYALGSTPIPIDFISLAMIVVGYAISILATQALGINGTYFGIELGFVEADYNFVKVFPYNAIPHPMIMGQVFALLGVFKPAHVHTVWPWLIPIHVLLYFTHMTQEIYDFWKGVPWYKQKSN